MSEPKLLSPEELNFDMGEAGNSDLPEARRLAALARIKAHIAALEAARSAAMLAWEDAERVSAAIARASGPVSEAERRASFRPPSPGERMLQRYWEMWGKVQKERDEAQAENAELLKAIGAFHEAWKTGRDTLALAALLKVARGPRPGAALLEELTSLRKQVAALVGDTANLMNRRALVRARNEGLEKAAVHFDNEADTHPGTQWNRTSCNIASTIRAMKEPES